MARPSDVVIVCRKAAVGFHHDSHKRFETEVRHVHLAFRNFTDAAVLAEPRDRYALAETEFNNCLFEDCGRGVVFVSFNDLRDNHSIVMSDFYVEQAMDGIVLEAQIDFKDMKRLGERQGVSRRSENDELQDQEEPAASAVRLTGATRLDDADEKILLRAMLQTFLDRSLCVRDTTDGNTQLVFPSYFKQDRPEIPKQPNVVVTYAFTGTLDEIYATLVVRLHYTSDFEIAELWRYAADFETLGGKRVGLLMTKKKGNVGQIKVYFDSGTQVETQVSFIKYIHEHLKKKAQDITRVRSYVCPHCDTPMGNREAIKKRLELGKTDILCGVCEERVELIDLIETKFASDALLRAVQKMDADAQINLDNESRELILVGQAITIAAEAGQIYRPTMWADWGIDGEIEFKNSKAQASGKRVYLQLKSGDSYLYHRQRDDVEIFTIKKKRQAEYWVSQAYPVMLVIRSSDGKIRWMNVTEYLRRHGADTKQVVFEGEAFTAGNVALMRNEVLGEE